MISGHGAVRACRFVMMFFLMFGIVASLASSPEQASAAPTFRLPWQKGSVWRITRGNSNLSNGHPDDTNNRFAFDAVPDLSRATSLVTAIARGEVVGFQRTVPPASKLKITVGHAGNCVILKHDNGLYSIYAHLAQYSVPESMRIGQIVESGQVIGAMGDTGFTQGAHLHWAVGTGARMYSSAGYDTCRIDSQESRYADEDKELQEDGGIPRTGRYYESFNPGQSTPPPPACSPTPLRAITSLSVTPANPKVNQTVTATFRVRNVDKCDWVAHWLGVGGRGPGGDQDYQDFKLYDPLPIAAGGEYTYSETRTFNKPGRFNFFIYSENSEIIPNDPSIVRTAAIDVAPCDPSVNLSKGIGFTPNPAVAGDSVKMSVTIANTGCGEFRTAKLWIDYYTPATNVVIPPGGSYTYTGESKVDKAADYEAIVYYQNAAGTSVKINGASGVSSSTVLRVTDPPTVTPTNTPTSTATMTATETVTATATSTATETANATNTATATATNTTVPTATFTPTATNTAIPTATFTPTATNTAIPTATFTPTATNTAIPTATFTPTATNTAIPTATFTPTATNTAIPTATFTPTATNTAVPTSTSTPVPTATPTSVPSRSPRISIDLVTGVRGTVVTVTGRGYQPGETVDIYWHSTREDGFILTTVVAENDGTFATSITIPEAERGTHRIIGLGHDSRQKPSRSFRILDAARNEAVNGAPADASATEGSAETPTEPAQEEAQAPMIVPSDGAAVVDATIDTTPEPPPAEETPASETPPSGDGAVSEEPASDQGTVEPEPTPQDDFSQPVEETPTDVAAPPADDGFTQPVAGGPVNVASVTASSHAIYDAPMAFDGNSSTAWIEGATGTGEQEFITVQFMETTHITAIVITNGFAANDALESAFGAPAEIMVSTPDGNSTMLTLSRTLESQRFEVDLTGDQLTFTIVSVIPGDILFDAIAISEIGFEGGPPASPTTDTAVPADDGSATVPDEQSVPVDESGTGDGQPILIDEGTPVSVEG